jgi:citrate lyase gamma subunit
MSMSTARFAVDTLVQELSAAHKPMINIVGIEKMHNEGSYVRVTASVTHTNKSASERNSIPSLIAQQLGSKLRPVARSFLAMSSSNVGHTISGIFTLNPESVAYEDNMTGFKSVSANMFMDDEEGLWVLRKTDSGKILVKSTGVEDADIISDLMSCVSSAGVGTLAYEASASLIRDDAVRYGVEGGDFVIFVNPVTESVEFGAVVASVETADGQATKNVIVQPNVEDADTVVIDRGMVVTQFDSVDMGDMNVSESASAKSLAEIAAYYKQVFIRDPAYYEKFMQRFQSVVFA